MIYANGQPTAEFVPEIADNLTTDDSTKALSAKQGKVLNEKTANDIPYSSGVSVKDKLDEKNGFSLYGTFTKSSSVETGTYPTDKSFIVSIFGSNVCTSVFVDSRYHLNKYVYLDSTHKAYFNTSGAFGMGDLEDGTVVVIIQMN